MKLLVLQHVPFEGPAAIAHWARSRNYHINYLFCGDNPAYPDEHEYDVLIIMGGPMGVNDPLDWIASEIQFIQRAIANNKLILGVCLGAQMIASALGATVRRHTHREIGWFEVDSVNSKLLAGTPFARLPSSFLCLHWHGDTFDIPAGAIHLYRSAACENQAFVYNERVVGLQFHLEFDEATTRRVAEASADELADGGAFVQPVDNILARTEHFATANDLMFELLDGLIRQAGR